MRALGSGPGLKGGVSSIMTKLPRLGLGLNQATCKVGVGVGFGEF